MQISSFMASIEAKVFGQGAKGQQQHSCHKKHLPWLRTPLGANQIRGERSKERQKSKKLTRPGSNLLKFPAGICSGRGLLEMSSALLEWNECFWEGQRGGGSSRRDDSRTRAGPPATKGKQGRAGMGLESREFPTGNPPLPWMSHPKVMDTEAKRQHSIVPTRRGFKQEI